MSATVTDLPTGATGVEDDPDLTDSDREAIHGINGTDPVADGGQSLEQLAEGEDEEGQTLLDFGDTLNLKFSGKKPNVSKIKIRAISREIKGQLGDKGDDEHVFCLVDAQLDENGTKTFRDENRRVTRKERRHTLEPIAVVRCPEALGTVLLERFADGSPISQEQIDAIAQILEG